ncbi:MAG: hypothetical protein R6V06_01460 [Kiritimatiellia bacterium]
MKRITLLLTAILIAASSNAQVKPSYIPADTMLLAHIDIKQLMNSKTGNLISESADEITQRKLDSFTAISEIDIKKDFDSLYFVSSDGGEHTGLFYVTGRFDVEKLTTILGGNEGFSSEPFGSGNILRWEDNGEAHYGSFVNNELLVASDDPARLKKALSLVEGKGEALSPKSPLAKIIPEKNNRFMSFAAYNVDGISKTAPQLQMLKRAKSVFFSIDQMSADRADVLLGAAISAADAQTAQQLSSMIQGFQSMMMMQASQNPEVARLAQNFKMASKNNTITMSLKLTEQQLRKQIADGIKKQQTWNTSSSNTTMSDEVK